MTGQKGFTVIELVVAMSVSALTLLTGYELFRTLKSVGDHQSRAEVETSQMMWIMAKIREDLMYAVPRTGSEGVIFAGSNPMPASESENTRFLEFYSLCADPYHEQVCGIRQVHKVTYDLVRNKDSINLCRSNIPVVDVNQTSETGNRRQILQPAEEVRVAFHNGKTLETTFSSKQSLPAYVEFKITAFGQVWPLTVRLPCGKQDRQP